MFCLVWQPFFAFCQLFVFIDNNLLQIAVQKNYLSKSKCFYSCTEAVLDMWNLSVPDKEKKKEAGGRNYDSYEIYVRIMKSVAESMNGL